MSDADPPPHPAAPPAAVNPATAMDAVPGRHAALWLAFVVGLLLAAALAAGIAWRRGSFDATAEVYTVVPNASGLSPGTAVRMSGVRIGEVRTLTLQPDLSVKLVLRIDAALFPRLHADARAQVVRESLRPAAIELEPGSATQPLNAADPKVALRDKASLSEMADELRGRLLPILDDLKATTGMLRERQGDIAAVMANAASATASLAAAAAEVNGLAGRTRGQVAEMGSQAGQMLVQGNGLLAQGNAALGKITGLIGQVDASLGLVNTALPGLMGKADATLNELNGVARDVRQITGSAAEALPPVLRAAPPLVDDARSLVDGLRASWAVRTLLGTAKPNPEWPIDSLDAGALREPLAR